jgi:hypothetical protein
MVVMAREVVLLVVRCKGRARSWIGSDSRNNGRRGFAAVRNETPDELKSSRHDLAQPCRALYSRYCKEGTQGRDALAGGAVTGDGLVRKATTCVQAMQRRPGQGRRQAADRRRQRQTHKDKRQGTLPAARHTIRPLDSFDQLGNIRLAFVNCNCWTVGPI